MPALIPASPAGSPVGLGRTLLAAAKPGWFLVVMAATIAAYSGQAEPYVSPRALPEGPLAMFGLAAGAILAGWLVLSAAERTLERSRWKRAGRDAGLSPEGGGLFGRPDLVGTVEGREVRARTLTRKRRSGGPEGSTTRKTFTIVEARLDQPAEHGLVVTPADGTEISSGATGFTLDSDAVAGAGGLATVEGGGFTVLGVDEDAARAVAEGASGSAMNGLDGSATIFAGPAADVLATAIPDTDGEGVGAWMQGKMLDKAEDTLRERIPGGPELVVAETEALLEEGDRLRRQARAVAAVAEALDEDAAR